MRRVSFSKKKFPENFSKTFPIYFTEFLRKRDEMTKKLIKKPVRVSKRFLNEGFLRAGQISFDFSKNALMNGAYGEGNLPSSPNPSALEKRNLRGAMVLRALLDYTGDVKRVASISEDLAAEIIGGEQLNSATFAGDNTTFADVKKGSALYSVKMRGQYTTDNRFSDVKISTIKQVLENRGNEVELGVILIDVKDIKNGFNFIHFEPKKYTESLVLVEENGKKYWQYNNTDILDTGRRSLPSGNRLRSKEDIALFFGTPTVTRYQVAKADQIDESLKIMYPAANPSPTFNNFLEKLVTADISDIIKSYPFFGEGLGAARGRSISFIKQSAQFVEDDETGKKREMVYRTSALFSSARDIMALIDKLPSNAKSQEIEDVTDMVKELNKSLTTKIARLRHFNPQTVAGGRIGSPPPRRGSSLDNLLTVQPRGGRMRLGEHLEESIQEKFFNELNMFKKNINTLLLIEKKNRRRSKCIPARRRIASGGKAGSYADPRTGGKQAYAALKQSKPPGSKGGWTKKKCICCHKCPNDRSAPNGFVCTNPSHLYWGTKADNTYDQNRGNGWAARNKNEMEGDALGKKAFARELMVSEEKLRIMINKILLEDDGSVIE